MYSFSRSYVSVSNGRVFSEGRIFEMCFDMPSGTEKGEKYQWVLLLGMKRILLDFVSADFSLGTRVLKFVDRDTGETVMVGLSLTENTLSLNYKDHTQCYKLSI